MIKLSPLFAGAAVAILSQYAAAQAGPTAPVPRAEPPVVAPAPVPANDPAYIDQSRLNQTNDPYVKKRIATKHAAKTYKEEKKESKQEYKEEKKEAKQEYKDKNTAAKSELQDTKKEASETRKEELSNPPPDAGVNK